jgi:hypothetical protein
MFFYEAIDARFLCFIISGHWGIGKQMYKTMQAVSFVYISPGPCTAPFTFTFEVCSVNHTRFFTPSTIYRRFVRKSMRSPFVSTIQAHLIFSVNHFGGSTSHTISRVVSFQCKCCICFLTFLAFSRHDIISYFSFKRKKGDKNR